jgi:hypothetical protein
MPDSSVREPDFTIRRPGQPTLHWEHLGMLDLAAYRNDWEAKLTWYAKYGILPWKQGGESTGTLVWSSERQGSRRIDAHEIKQLAIEVLDGRA